MNVDTPPSDHEILAIIESGVTEPRLLIAALQNDHEIKNVIEALQRALERGKITFDNDGKVVATKELAKAA